MLIMSALGSERRKQILMPPLALMNIATHIVILADQLYIKVNEMIPMGPLLVNSSGKMLLTDAVKLLATAHRAWRCSWCYDLYKLGGRKDNYC